MTTCFVQTTVESDGDAFKQLNAVFQVSSWMLTSLRFLIFS